MRSFSCLHLHLRRPGIFSCRFVADERIAKHWSSGPGGILNHQFLTTPVQKRKAVKAGADFLYKKVG